MAKKGLIIWKLGNVEHQIYPSPEDLREFGKMIEKSLPKRFKDDYDGIIFPPLITPEIVNYGGHKTVVFKVGDVGSGIYPNKEDLRSIKEMVEKSLKGSGFYKTYKMEVKSVSELMSMEVIQDKKVK